MTALTIARLVIVDRLTAALFRCDFLSKPGKNLFFQALRKYCACQLLIFVV
jgi:hypothetical protein